MAKIQFLRKISIGTVFGKVPAKLAGQIELGTYVGSIQLAERLEGDKGEYVRFRGSFGARFDGNEYRSNVLYLPSYLADAMESAFKSLGEGSALEFAYKLHARPNEKSATGYEYSHESLVEEETSTLDRLFTIAGPDSSKALPPGESSGDAPKAEKAKKAKK
jgi:hypothetical protein